MKLDLNFRPTIQQQFFKELIHDKLTDEEIVELRVAPSIYINKLAPFKLEDVEHWLNDDNIFLFLTIKDPELVLLEMERPNLYRELREMALGEVAMDARDCTTKIKAIEATLKLLEKTSTSRKQRNTKAESNVEAKLLKALPKQLSRLSDFELEVANKQVKELCDTVPD